MVRWIGSAFFDRIAGFTGIGGFWTGLQDLQENVDLALTLTDYLAPTLGFAAGFPRMQRYIDCLRNCFRPNAEWLAEAIAKHD